MKRFICIHGHFYQPPRENPWLEEIEVQDSAYPYHDWNSRISAECYAPNAAAHILSGHKIVDIVNNYSRISFNFGPTLLTWLQRCQPQVYQSIIEADIKSREHFSGHGSALAQAYNHIIMPLANPRDKRTQIIWGIYDFEHRFGRKPEGMWLPEAAVDCETLDILAELGIKFTILSPGQAKAVRKIDEEKWHNCEGARIDPKKPYLCNLPSGRSIAIFFYDGPISRDIAFGDLLTKGENLAHRLESAFLHDDAMQLVHISTDGETYGHHHRFGDMALSYCLHYIETNGLAGITIYGEYLSLHPPEYEVKIHENSSWSCFHGVERWRNNCGCNSGMHANWHQQWRAPLRQALDWLCDNMAGVYEKSAGNLLRDPWLARDEYIEVVFNRSPETIEKFFCRNARHNLSDEEKIKALKLLEMQRSAMLMYTSCGWFFDEISGIETVQIMHYAARAMQLTQEISGLSLEDLFMKLLERAPSNISKFANGAAVYQALVKPAIIDLLRVGVHYAVSSIFQADKPQSKVYCYTITNKGYDLCEMGKHKLIIGRAHIKSDITAEESEVSFAVMHFGDHNLVASAREYMREPAFAQMSKEIKESFLNNEIQGVINGLNRHFGQTSYSLWHLFRDEQRVVLKNIFKAAMDEMYGSFRQIFNHQSSLMQIAHKLNTPLPKQFSMISEFVLNHEIREMLKKDELIDSEKFNRLVEDINRFSLQLDKQKLEFIASQRIDCLMESFFRNPQDGNILNQLVGLLQAVENLKLDINLWKSQNLYFSIGKQIYSSMQEQALNHNEAKIEWVNQFKVLGGYLKIDFE